MLNKHHTYLLRIPYIHHSPSQYQNGWLQRPDISNSNNSTLELSGPIEYLEPTPQRSRYLDLVSGSLTYVHIPSRVPPSFYSLLENGNPVARLISEVTCHFPLSISLSSHPSQPPISLVSSAVWFHNASIRLGASTVITVTYN